MGIGARKCPVKSCAELIPDHGSLCTAHWAAVPVALRNAVWEARTLHGAGSAEHRLAVQVAATAVSK